MQKAPRGGGACVDVESGFFGVWEASLKPQLDAGTQALSLPYPSEIALPKRELEHLSKLCGMFGSAHAGERATAAQKAHELIRRRGMTWDDLLLPRAQSQGDISTMSSTSNMSCAKKLKLLRDHIDLLNDWEVDFICGVSRCRRPTAKQYAVLNRLVQQVLEATR